MAKMVRTLMLVCAILSSTQAMASPATQGNSDLLSIYAAVFRARAVEAIQHSRSETERRAVLSDLEKRVQELSPVEQLALVNDLINVLDEVEANTKGAIDKLETIIIFQLIAALFVIKVLHKKSKGLVVGAVAMSGVSVWMATDLQSAAKSLYENIHVFRSELLNLRMTLVNRQQAEQLN